MGGKLKQIKKITALGVAATAFVMSGESCAKEDLKEQPVISSEKEVTPKPNIVKKPPNDVMKSITHYPDGTRRPPEEFLELMDAWQADQPGETPEETEKRRAWEKKQIEKGLPLP